MSPNPLNLNILIYETQIRTEPTSQSHSVGAAADTGRHIPSIVSFWNLERKGKEPGLSVLTRPGNRSQRLSEGRRRT